MTTVPQRPGRLNLRPKGSANAPGYSPHRDLAYVYPHAMREALAGLDEANWRDYFRPWCEATNLTEDELGEGVRRYVEAHKDFIGDPEIKHADDALAKHGFFELPNIVRILIYARLGEVMLGGFFYALRDVTRQNCAPPQAADIADLIAEGKLVAARLWGQKRDPSELDRLEHEAIAALDQLREVHKTVDTLRADNGRLYEDLSKTKQELAMQTIKCNYTDGLGLWGHIKHWWEQRRLRRCGLRGATASGTEILNGTKEVKAQDGSQDRAPSR